MKKLKINKYDDTEIALSELVTSHSTETRHTDKIMLTVLTKVLSTVQPPLLAG